LRDRTDASNVLFPIDGRETKAKAPSKFLSMGFLQHSRTGIERMTDIISVEHRAMDTMPMQLMVEGIGDRTLT
jgi:hypothetical protein